MGSFFYFHRHREPMGDHGNIIVIQNEAEFRRRIKQATGLVVVDWSASWCGPCKRIFPAVVQYSREYPETVFLNVDVDANPDLAAEYDIRAMPTFLFFKNGSVYDKLQGADPNALGEKLEASSEILGFWSTIRWYYGRYSSCITTITYSSISSTC